MSLSKLSASATTGSEMICCHLLLEKCNDCKISCLRELIGTNANTFGPRSGRWIGVSADKVSRATSCYSKPQSVAICSGKHSKAFNRVELFMTPPLLNILI